MIRLRVSLTISVYFQFNVLYWLEMTLKLSEEVYVCNCVLCLSGFSRAAGAEG